MTRAIVGWGLLSVAAISWGLWGAGTTASSHERAGVTASAEAARPTHSAAAQAATNAPAGIALVRMDTEQLRREAPRWVVDPVRDPFQPVRPPAAEGPAPESPVSQFRLGATWMQTGARLAVIDQKVFREGDELVGYRIVRIEPAKVLVQGRERVEEITFTSYRPDAPKTSWVPTNVGGVWLGPEREKLF